MLTVNNTRLETWFERDRAHVALQDRETEAPILDVWDDAVNEAVEDGFLSIKGFVMGREFNRGPLHESAVEWANGIGATPANPVVIRPVTAEEEEEYYDESTEEEE